MRDRNLNRIKSPILDPSTISRTKILDVEILNIM